jgi:hypothetical protein
MIRDMEEKDIETLKAIHRESGLDYLFPALGDPLFVVKKCSQEEGRAIQGIAVKLEGTVYLILDHGWSTPEARWQKLQELVEEVKLAAWRKGLDTLTCVVPPELVGSFGKRLEAMGLSEDRPWKKYSFDLTKYVPAVRVESADEKPCVSS